MPKTHKEDNILALLGGVLLMYLGEGIFGAGIYWVTLVLLSDRPWVYYYAFGLGILGSLMTGTTAGLLSLILVVWLILFIKLIGPLQKNLIVVLLIVVFGNFLADKLIGAGWGVGEMVANVLLVSLVFFGRQGGAELRLKT